MKQEPSDQNLVFKWCNFKVDASAALFQVDIQIIPNSFNIFFDGQEELMTYYILFDLLIFYSSSRCPCIVFLLCFMLRCGVEISRYHITVVGVSAALIMEQVLSSGKTPSGHDEIVSLGRSQESSQRRVNGNI